MAWAQSNYFYGLFCGLSCPGTVYVAKSNTIQAYTATGSTQQVADAQMLCLNGDRDLNVLLLRSLTWLKQVDLAGGLVTTLLSQSSTALCSVGVSGAYLTVLLVQAGQETLLVLSSLLRSVCCQSECHGESQSFYSLWLL